MPFSALVRRVVGRANLLVPAVSIGCGVSGCTLINGGVSQSEYEKLPEMIITRGLESHQVVQRDENDQGTIHCEGTCEVDGEVWARVFMPKRRNPPGIKLHRAGAARNHQWSATIRGIPVGGEWMVELSVRDSAGRPLSKTAGAWPVLVGDLWILAGQSNMQGYGDMTGVEEPSPLVCAYGMNEKWSIAEEPLHWLNESPDPAHHPGKSPEEIDEARNAPRGKPGKGTGPGLPFAKRLVARTNVPIGLLPCAHGGTSMDQWDPARKDLGGKSLYGSMLRRFHAVGGRVKGVLWYQGESDASPQAQPPYRKKMERFIESVRDDFGNPKLPFYLVQLSRVTHISIDPGAWSAIQQDQRLIGREIPGVVTVSAIDLELDDLIHIGTQGNKRLGRRLARVADRELFGNRAVTTGPRLKSVSVEKGPNDLVRVVFDGVNGQLKPKNHIAGFALRAADAEKPGLDFYDVIVDPEAPNAVLCQVQGPIPPGMNLWYGYGLNPYCNLVDEQDLAVLAFGPVQVTPPATQPDK